MLGKYWVPSREGIVKTMKDTFAKANMLAGNNMVIDNMNLNPKEVEYWRDLIEYNNDYYTKARGEYPSTYKANYFYELEFKDFFIPVEECIRRDSLRPNPIGEKVIRETWNKYKHTIVLSENQKILTRKLQQDKDKPAAIVVDMDATLCINTSGRPFYGEGAAEGMLTDTPIEELVELLNLNHLYYHIIVLTGREDTPEIREATEKWLIDHGIEFSKVIMRPQGDLTKGNIFKKKAMEEQILPNYRVRFILEDSSKCVETFREMGLLVLQPNEGKF